ncbi:MAG: glycosyl hydrolase 53 family protein [Chthoniobacterales bacterium]
MNGFTLRILFGIAAVTAALRTIAAAPPDTAAVFAGADANYSLGMEKDGQKWLWNGKSGDLFKGIAERGVHGFRVRLWTKDDGQNGKIYATEIVKRALAAGLEPYLVIFLSDDWADLMKQPVPAAWKDLDFTKRVETVRKYSRDIVIHFRKQGLKSHLYEIGNEIDYGICGVYPGKSTKKTPESLSRNCWPQAAELIKASEAGVLEADPDAKFLLHVAHWWDAKFCIAFFRFMLANGVKVDYAGLTYYPSANIGGSLEMEQFGDVVAQVHAAAGCPVILPEVAYPSTADFKGQFSRWKKETPGYPLTPDGQRRWLSDFLDFCAHRPEIAGVYYWSPEWCGEGMWKAFALFDPKSESKPAWSAFATPRDKRPKPKSSVYFEVADGKLHAVPIAEMRKKAAPILAGKLKKYGRVNIDYIHDVSATPLVVGGYSADLHATISGNLDLTLQPDAPAVSANSAFKKTDPTAQRIVVLTRNPGDPMVATATAAARKLGVEAIVHPVAADKPLKFGLGGAQADAAY